MEQGTLYEGLTPDNDSAVSYMGQEKLDQRFTPNVFRVFMLSYLFSHNSFYVTMTLFCLCGL